MSAIYERLRQQREMKGIALDALEQRTGVRVRILEAIERGNFAELPRGLYGRSAIRAYALAVDMEPADVLAAVVPLLPKMEDPIEGLARVRGIAPRRSVDQRNDLAGQRAFYETALHSLPWRALAAIAFDAGALALIDLVVLWLTALACGTHVAYVARAAAPALALMFLLIASLYFLLLGGVGNATLGASIARTISTETNGQIMDVRMVGTRAFRCAVREASLLVEWLMRTDNGQRCLRALRWRRA